MRNYFFKKIYQELFCCFFLVIFFCADSFARSSTTTYAVNGKPLFIFDIADNEGEVYAGDRNPSGGNWQYNLVSQHKDALVDASNYWASILGSLIRNVNPVKISVGIYNEKNDSATSFIWSSETTLTAAIIGGYTGSGGSWENSNYIGNVYAQIQIGFVSSPYLDYFGQTELIQSGLNIDTSGWEYQRMQILPNNRYTDSFAAIMVHELGHAFGVLSFNDGEKFGELSNNLFVFDSHLKDSFGNAAAVNRTIAIGNTGDTSKFVIVPNGYAYFQGTNVFDVIGAETYFPLNNPNHIAGIPINGFEGGYAELSHIELQNSMMSHQNYRNWNIFMEAELALLQDIGILLDRKNIYGGSLYKDNQTISANTSFYKRTSDGGAYLIGQYNSTDLTIGYHIYGSSNTVNFSGTVLQNGYSTAGIRIDGWNNNFTIANNSIVHSDGQDSFGLLVSYGRNHKIISNGTVTALGEGGVGVSFDFGDNLLGDIEEYRGSFRRGSFTDIGNGNFRFSPKSSLYELGDALVDRFDVSGTINGKLAAIYISNNAFVKEINFMSGSNITGNIVSDWSPTTSISDVFNYVNLSGTPYNIADLQTWLTFGYSADGNGSKGNSVNNNFSLNYGGDIIGKNFLNIEIAGGSLTLTGSIKGVSQIKKTSGGEFNFSGDGSYFNGFFLQTAGATKNINKYFAGVSSITGGTLEFGQDTVLNPQGRIGIWGGNTKLDITALTGAITLTGTLEGNGIINKINGGTFNITSKFDFTGFFKQTAGNTKVTVDYLASRSSVAGGIFELAQNARINSASLFQVFGNGEFLITSNDPFLFNGNFSGDGKFTKTGTGILNLENKFDFTGFFKQTAGNTKVTVDYLASRSSVAGGVFELAQNAKINSASLFQVFGTGEFLITSNDSFLFNGNFFGDGKFTKTGTGILSLVGDVSSFNGIFSQSAGTTTLTNGKFFEGTSIISNGSFLELNQGAEFSNNSAIQILGQNSSLILKTNNNLTFNGNVPGNGMIFKRSEALLTLTGANDVFSGYFQQSSGTTVNFGNYFAGISSVTGGILEFAQGTALSGSSKIEIWGESANLNITSSDTASFENNVIGNGNINKTSAGEIRISGNNSGFSGVFNQTAGSAVISTGTFFTGTNNFYNAFLIIKNVLFTGGKSNFRGGALYAENSFVFIESGTFHSNTVQNMPNDIFLYNSSVTINQAYIGGGISSDIRSTDTVVVKNTSGTLYLGGNNAIYGDFKVNEGTVKMLSGSSLRAKYVEVPVGAIFDTQNDTAEQFEFENFTLYGTLKVDVRSFQENTDFINVSSRAEIGGALDIKASFGKYADKYYKIISFGDLYGTFSTFTVIGLNENNDIKFALNYDFLSKSITFGLDGVNNSGFLDIPNVSGNKKSVAKLIDDASANLSSDSNLMHIASRIGDYLNYENQTKAEEILLKLSGYFLSNLVRSAGSDIVSDTVLDLGEDSKIFVKVESGKETLNEDENSAYKYENSKLGAVVGVGRNYGAYVKVGKETIKQGLSEAEGLKTRVGGFVKLLKEGYELKMDLAAGYASYDSKRDVFVDELGGIAESELKGFLMGINAEYSLKRELTRCLTFLPFAALGFQMFDYENFEEIGAPGANLTVKSGNYDRSDFRFGIKNKLTLNNIDAYFKLEGKYLFSGFRPKTENAFREYNDEFAVVYGFEESPFSVGLSVGLGIKIKKDFKIVADLGGDFSSGSNNIAGSIGMKFLLKNSKIAETQWEEYTLSHSLDYESDSDGKESELDETGQRLKEHFETEEFNKKIKKFRAVKSFQEYLLRNSNIKYSNKEIEEFLFNDDGSFRGWVRTGEDGAITNFDTLTMIAEAQWKKRKSFRRSDYKLNSDGDESELGKKDFKEKKFAAIKSFQEYLLRNSNIKYSNKEIEKFLFNDDGSSRGWVRTGEDGAITNFEALITILEKVQNEIFD